MASINWSLQLLVPTRRAKFVFLISLSTVFYREERHGKQRCMASLLSSATENKNKQTNTHFRRGGQQSIECFWLLSGLPHCEVCVGSECVYVSAWLVRVGWSAGVCMCIVLKCVEATDEMSMFKILELPWQKWVCFYKELEGNLFLQKSRHLHTCSLMYY